MGDQIGIAEAVAQLRAELSEAIRAAADEQVRFEVGEIQLTFEVAVERTVEGKARFWVIEAGGGGSRTETHSVTIPLTPVSSSGDPILTGADAETPAPPALG